MGSLDRYLSIETIASIPGHAEFADAALRTNELQGWQVLALAAQVADCIGSDKLLCWAQGQGRRSVIANETEEALMRLVMDDAPETGVALRGYTGHYVAVRVADMAYRDGNLSLMERAVDRMHHAPTTAPDCERAGTALVCTIMYDALLTERSSGFLQRSRLQECSAKLAPWQRQLMFLTLQRLRYGMSFGGAA